MMTSMNQQPLQQGVEFSGSMPSRYPMVTSCQLRATADLLRLPEHATASALVFMHRFKRDCRELDTSDDVWLRPACLLE